MTIVESKEIIDFIASISDAEYASEEIDALFNEYRFSLRKKGKRNEPNGFRDDLAKTAKSIGMKKGHVDAILARSKKIDEALITSIPYYKALQGIEASHRGIRLVWNAYEKDELFLLDEPLISERNPGEEIGSYGYFDHRFLYPALSKNGRVWMSLIPHEIMTMRESLEHASGNVLVYGLGLGYFAAEAAAKESVTSVTVVELDQDIIAFFKETLLPHIEGAEKIRIIEADALSFASKVNPGEFDFLFADLWRNEEDGIPLYGKLLARQKNIPEAEYWVEKSMLIFLRRHVINYLQERLEGFGDDAYENEESLSDFLFAATNRYFNQTTIASKEDVLNALSENTLKDILLEAFK